MTILQFFKQRFCEHDFHLLSEYDYDNDPTIGYDKQRMCVIYCPKCKREEHVLKHRYEAIKKRQEIDEEHGKK